MRLMQWNKFMPRVTAWMIVCFRRPPLRAHSAGVEDFATCRQEKKTQTGPTLLPSSPWIPLSLVFFPHVSEQYSAKWTIKTCSLLSSQKSTRKFRIASGREGGGCGRLSPPFFLFFSVNSWCLSSPWWWCHPTQCDHCCDIRAPRRCWRPCASGWSPCGWRALNSALAAAETVPSGYAAQSPFSCPSDGPGFNTMTKNRFGQLNAFQYKHSQHKYSVALL